MDAQDERPAGGLPPGTLRVLAHAPGLTAVLVRDEAAGAARVWARVGDEAAAAVLLGPDEAPAAVAAGLPPATPPHVRHRCQAALALALGQLGPASEALAHAAAAAPLAERPDDWLALATTALEQGDLEGAWSAATQAAEQGEAAGDAYAEGGGRALLAEVLAYRGEAEAADAMIGRAFGALWGAGMPSATAEAMGRWAWALLRTGRLDAADEQVERLQALAEADPGAPDEALGRLRAALAAARGLADAPARLDPLVAEARAAEHPLRLAELLRWLGGWKLRRAGRDAPVAELAEAGALAARTGQGRLLRELATLRAAPADAGAPGAIRRLAGRMAGISAQREAQPVIAQALAGLVELLGAERGFLVAHDGLAITGVHAHGEAARDLDAFSTGLLDHVVWGGEAVFIDDLAAHPAIGARDGGQTLGLRAAFGLPLFDGDRQIGVMLADSRAPMAPPDGEALAAADALGRHAALALVHARACAEHAVASRALEAGRRAALLAAGARGLDDAMPGIAREAAAACGAERVLVLGGDPLAVVAAYDAHGEPLPADGRGFSRTIAGCVLASGQPLHVEDPLRQSAFAGQASIQDLGDRTVDVAPIRHGGRVLGLLYADHPAELEERPPATAALSGIADAIGALLAR